MPGIFISYRRADSAGWAGRLYDRLVAHFGNEKIFMDIDAIEPGVDFVEVINDNVGSCDALIAIIGTRWWNAADETGNHRLDNPNDFVRLEIAAALIRGVRVIPALVEGATMPPNELPEPLEPLRRRNAIEIGPRFHPEVDRLIPVLERVLIDADKRRAEAKRRKEQERQEALEAQRNREADEPRRGSDGRTDDRRSAPVQVEAAPRQSWFSHVVQSLSGAPTLAGIDIGSRAIKLVDLRLDSSNSWLLTNVGQELIAPGAIVDGRILDPQEVASAIEVLVKKSPSKTKDVATAVSGSSVVAKTIVLPSMNDEELAEVIHWEAEQYIPFDIQDVNLDYQVLAPGKPGGNMDILLIAAKKDKINDYQSVITQAGRNPVVMDFAAFAIQNAFEMTYGTGSEDLIALVNIGAAETNINIIRHHTSVFIRDQAVGGNRYTEALEKQLHVGFNTAELIKQDRDSSDEALDKICGEVTASVVEELNSVFDFFYATTSQNAIHRIVLSGGAARTRGLVEAMADRFDCPVEILNPFRNLTSGSYDAAHLEEIGPAFAVAVGLAMRRANE